MKTYTFLLATHLCAIENESLSFENPLDSRHFSVHQTQNRIGSLLFDVPIDDEHVHQFTRWFVRLSVDEFLKEYEC